MRSHSRCLVVGRRVTSEKISSMPQAAKARFSDFGDGDRDFYSVGIGYISTKNNWGFDIGYEYLEMEDRSSHH